MKLYRLSLLFLVLLIITGCTQIDDQIVLNEDGSALREIIVTVDKSNESYSDEKAKTSIEKAEEAFINRGYDFEIKENVGNIKIKITKKIEGVDQGELRVFFYEESDGTDSKEDLTISKKDNFFYAVHNSSGDISINYLKEEFGMQSIDYRFYLSFPEKVHGEHNAQAVRNDGKTLAWKLPVDSTQKIYVEAYTIDSGQVMMVGGPVIGILLIAFYLMLTNKVQQPPVQRRLPVNKNE